MMKRGASAADRPRTTEAEARAPSAENPVLAACRALFEAYDIDESGELSRQEYLQIETRLAFEKGEVFNEKTTAAQITLADKDSSGQIDFHEFQTRNLRTLTELGMTEAEMIAHFSSMTRMALEERAKMGPRYHAGIRQMLKKIFRLYDVSGDGVLSPDEWVTAQKIIAAELNDDMDEGWIEEAAFLAADENGDGVVQFSEYMEASFSMFEGLKQRTDQIFADLQKVQKALERSKPETEPANVEIMLQAEDAKTFVSPLMATCGSDGAWLSGPSVRLPGNLKTAEEVSELVRLSLRIPAASWISLYFIGPTTDKPLAPVTLLRDSNAEEAVDYLAKPQAQQRLFVKNSRQRPTRLSHQPSVWLEEADAIMSRRTGESLAFDWETQLLGAAKGKLPPMPLPITIGDAVMVEVPSTQGSGQYSFATKAYMDATQVLSAPVEAVVEVKAKKKKKKKAPDAGPAPDAPVQLNFVGLKEGKCVLFVEISWEDQEEKLCATQGVEQPCAENSIYRIGPIEVDVQKPESRISGSKDKTAPPIRWWTGDKWANKKAGPAKKKK